MIQIILIRRERFKAFRGSSRNSVLRQIKKGNAGACARVKSRGSSYKRKKDTDTVEVDVEDEVIDGDRNGSESSYSNQQSKRSDGDDSSGPSPSTYPVKSKKLVAGGKHLPKMKKKSSGTSRNDEESSSLEETS